MGLPRIWVGKHLVDQDRQIFGSFPLDPESLWKRPAWFCCGISMMIDGGNNISARRKIVARTNPVTTQNSWCRETGCEGSRFN